MTVTAWNPLTCECGSIEWTVGTEPVSKNKDGHMLPRHCRRCGAPGPDQHVSYTGKRAWASDPDKKQAPQPPAPVKETKTVPEKTPVEQMREELETLIPKVSDVLQAKNRAERLHAALKALGEQLDPLPWKAKKS